MTTPGDSTRTSLGPVNRRDTPCPIRGGKLPTPTPAQNPAPPGPWYPGLGEERPAPRIALRPRRRRAACQPAWRPRDPHPRRFLSSPQDLPPAPPADSHLRGAPVAELVGDGLDAPGPGHRDVAALRTHVQPHHRHGRLAVCLRLGLGVCPPAAASCPCRTPLPRGPTAPLSLAQTHGQSARLEAPASRGRWRLAKE